MVVSGKCAHRTSVDPVEIIYFTLIAAVLYLFSNWLVERLEVAAGRRFEYRSLLFFVILLSLALTSFYLIRLYTGNP